MKSVISSSSRRPSPRSISSSPISPTMCSGPMSPSCERNENVARLLERRLAPVDVEARAHDDVGVELARARAAMRRSALMCVPGDNHSPNSTGSRADVVVQTMSASRTASAPVGAIDASSSNRSRATSTSVSRVVGVAAPDAKRLDRPHGAHRLEMRVRLNAGSDDGERRCVFAREQTRRDRGDGGGANHRDRVSRRGRAARLPFSRIEEQHRALMRVERGAVIPWKDGDDLARRHRSSALAEVAGHDRERVLSCWA